MSNRNGKNKMKLDLLNELNKIDKSLKRCKSDEEKTSQLMSKRNTIRTKLKTK